MSTDPAEPTFPAPPAAPLAPAASGGPFEAPRPPEAHRDPAPHRDPAYERLVEGDDDLVGLLAYGLFAQHRQQFAERFRRERGGAASTADAVAFTEGALVPFQVEGYRTRANEVLGRYAEAALGQLAAEAGNRAVAGRVELAAERAERAGRLGRQLFVALLAALLTVAGLVLVAGLLPDIGALIGRALEGLVRRP